MSHQQLSSNEISMEHVLMWFRADLRVMDNTALNAAIETEKPIIALYTVTPNQWQQHDVAAIQIDFIERRLAVLKQQLAALNIPLLVLTTPDFSQLPQAISELCQQYNITDVYCNRQYVLNEQCRDDAVSLQLQQYQKHLFSFDDFCILPPGSVGNKNKRGEMYKVFTPFRNVWLPLYLTTDCQPKTTTTTVILSQQTQQLLAVSTTITPFEYVKTSSELWPVDEQTIHQNLNSFCQTKANLYHSQRDYPWMNGTSCLSPYLTIGALSPRQCIAALQKYIPQSTEVNKDNGGFVWFNEIIWREFNNHLIYHYPDLCRHQPFQEYTQWVQWQNDERHIQAWQQGLTGYPIVDAAMRQLMAIGWMHNRLRMITASFLTKDLLCDWRIGERWFIRHLIDGELASNNGGWQWASSTGTDAQPYFRIFNPIKQGEKFDPEGVFVRQWLPELKDVPNKYIHTPTLWPEFGDIDYPAPIVDHNVMRLQAIENFKQAKEHYERLLSS